MWTPLSVTWALLRKRATETSMDGYPSLDARLAALNAYREEGTSAAQAGLDMGLVGYEELHDEEAYEAQHST